MMHDARCTMYHAIPMTHDRTHIVEVNQANWAWSFRQQQERLPSNKLGPYYSVWGMPRYHLFYFILFFIYLILFSIILFYFILFYFLLILLYFILFLFILFQFILFYFILFYYF